MRFRAVNERVQKNSGDSFYSHKVVQIKAETKYLMMGVFCNKIS